MYPIHDIFFPFKDAILRYDYVMARQNGQLQAWIFSVLQSQKSKYSPLFPSHESSLLVCFTKNRSTL